MKKPERKHRSFCKWYKANSLTSPDNIRWFYFFLIFSQYFAITLTASNNAVFFLTKGISVEWLAYLGTVSALTIVLFEFPTGLISDRFGNTLSIVLSLILRGGASLAVVVCYGPMMFCFITVISSIGFTFFSGANEAWIFNKDKSIKEDMTNFFSNLFIFTGIARIIGGLTGGLLAATLPQLPFLLAGLVLLILSGIIVLFECGSDMPKRKEIENTKKIDPHILIGDAKTAIKSIYGNDCLLYFVLSGVFFIIFCGIPLIYWQPFFYDTMGGVGTLGFIWAGFISMNILGNLTLKHSFLKRLNEFNLFGWLILCCGLALFISASLKNNVLLSIGGFFSYQFFLGIIGPLRGKIINKKVADEKRASILSFISLLESIGSMIGFSIAGYLCKHIGLQYLFLMALVPLTVSLLTARVALIKEKASF